MPNSKRTPWEYKRIKVRDTTGARVKFITDSELEQLGSQQWELVSVTEDEWVFIRPKNQAA